MKFKYISKGTEVCICILDIWHQRWWKLRRSENLCVVLNPENPSHDSDRKFQCAVLGGKAMAAADSQKPRSDAPANFSGRAPQKLLASSAFAR